MRSAEAHVLNNGHITNRKVVWLFQATRFYDFGVMEYWSVAKMFTFIWVIDPLNNIASDNPACRAIASATAGVLCEIQKALVYA